MHASPWLDEFECFTNSPLGRRYIVLKEKMQKRMCSASDLTARVHKAMLSRTYETLRRTAYTLGSACHANTSIAHLEIGYVHG